MLAIAAGSAIKIESKREMPTAICAGIPSSVSIGITSIGPPAPEAAQIAPVTIPSIR